MADDTKTTLPFVPLADQPHNTALLGCAACGHLWQGVWPSRTPVTALVCPQCGVVGRAIIDPPRSADTQPAMADDTPTVEQAKAAYLAARSVWFNYCGTNEAARLDANAKLDALIAAVRAEQTAMADDTLTVEQARQVDQLLHDASRAVGGYEMAARMNDPENAGKLKLKAARLFAEALALDPEGQSFAWFQ